jgi:hypothetical protein
MFAGRIARKIGRDFGVRRGEQVMASVHITDRIEPRIRGCSCFPKAHLATRLASGLMLPKAA